MHRQLKFVIWFPIVLVAAFAAGYLFWQKTLIPGPYDIEPVNVVRHQIAKSSDTSGWQTYRNEENGFEVKYPAEWFSKDITVDPRDDIKLADYIIMIDSRPITNNGREAMHLSSRGLKIITRTFFYPHFASCPPEPELLSTDPIVIDSKSYIRCKLEFGFTIPVVHNNILYNFGYPADSFDTNTTNQILSTFKFLTTETQKGQESAELCIQVITPARNPQTGETRDFPTPCDVPEGWEIIK